MVMRPPELHDLRIEEALLRRTAVSPHALALEDLDRRLDYAELLSWASAFAELLRQRGCRRGDRVAIFLDKSLEQVVALFGVWLAGGIAVPIASTLKRQQLAYIVTHSESALLVSTPFKLRRASVDGPEGLGTIELVLVPERDATAHAPPAPIPPGRDEAAALLYTSGSTGLPKGVVVSHENLCAGARIVTRYLELRPDDRILSVLPFSFDYGLNQLLISVRAGACLVLQRSLRAVDITRTLERASITVLAGVPTLWLQLLDPMSAFERTALPALRILTNSGGVFPVEAVRRYRQHLPGCRIFLMYGLTEAFRSTFLPPEQIDERPSSMGKAIPECEMLILDESGAVVAPGEVGELVHRGPTVSLGYWRDPEATANKFRPDPLDPAATRPVVYSGDLVRTDDKGYLYFVGRRDQMMKAYGYRISPTEVESLIFQSGWVREVVVKGVADELAGQRTVAYCLPGEGFSPERLMEFCQREMPSYMIPREIIVCADFPRTGSGKVDRVQVGA
jgi:acyl-CoA ligase (AMP-forming) (exosortase A-associated)